MQVAKVARKYGLTIEEIAKRLGYSHSSSLRGCLSNKNGKPANMHLSTLRAIADAIGCSVGEFFDDERVELTKGWNGQQPKINIRRVMQLQGITDKDLAVRLNVSERQVKNYLHEKKMPNATTLYNIASSLNVPITELFSYE